MSWEHRALQDKIHGILYCPKCNKSFEPFMRGQVVRFDWFGFRDKYCALICSKCKEIIGYESPF